jgi:hypothetical protein
VVWVFVFLKERNHLSDVFAVCGSIPGRFKIIVFTSKLADRLCGPWAPAAFFLVVKRSARETDNANVVPML